MEQLEGKVAVVTGAGSGIGAGVRNDDPYIITHPGSHPAVTDRHAGIEAAYRTQRQRHPELP